ncbi:MAG: hypothetical protein AAGD43_14420 [Pseudomonadota bacterium]
MRLTAILRRGLLAGSVAVLALSLAGCRDYFARKDTLNYGGGNAVAENKVAQTIDPWPPRAFKKSQVTNGERMREAAKRYEDGPPKKQKPVSVFVTKQ